MRRSLLHLTLAVSATAAVALAACSDDSSGTTSTPLASSGVPSATDDTTASSIDMSGVSLKVAISTENALGMFIEQSGVYADAPYDIEWVQMSGSNETIEAVNAGAVDVAASVQVPAVVLAQANSTQPWTADDAPIRVVAGWDILASPGFVLVVRADSDIQTVADLRGRTVSLAKGAWGQFFWTDARTQAGLADGEVEEVFLSATDGRTAFRAGQVDAVIAGHRSGLTLQDEGIGRIIASADEYSTYMTLSLARGGLLDDPARAAAVGDLLQRMAAEDRWIDDHNDIVAEQFIADFDLTPATAEIAARGEVRTRVPLDDQVIALLQEVADTFLSLGSAKTQTDVTIIIDDRFNEGLVRQT